MAHTQGNSLPLQLLASVAQDAHEILFPVAVQNESGSAANIAIRLMLIANNVPEQELFRISLTVQSASTEALWDLLQIAEWPPSSIRRGQCYVETDPQAIRHTLGYLLRNEQSKRQVKQSVTQFCKAPLHVIRPFESRFIRLSDLLEKNIPKSQRVPTDTIPYPEPPLSDSHPEQIHKLLFDAVKNRATCVLEDHVERGLWGTAQTNWHITKLCLESEFLSGSQRVFFKIIMATSKMTHWQEFAFRIPIMNAKSKDARESREDGTDSFDTSEMHLIGNGNCGYLDDPINARIIIELDNNCHLYQLKDVEKVVYGISGHGLPLSTLLKQGDLTVEQKVKLSYTVARAFWQFYNSELMNSRWTSEDIFLFRLNPEILSSEDVLLKAFVSLPFSGQYKESPAECYNEGYYTHRYPRILYLGVILLEIGLGQPLGVKYDSDSYDAKNVNLVAAKADWKLRELEKAKWDGFVSKDYFVEAVRNCLDYSNFKGTKNHRKTRCKRKSNEEPYISERRETLYRKVVAPLLWLATVGFEGSNKPQLIRVPTAMHSKSPSASDEKLQHSWEEIRRTHSSFLSGSSGGGESFLDHLQVIAGHITRCRRLGKATKPIQVAILDTGYQKALPFFKDDRRCNRLRGWKDFTTTKSRSPVDTFGHGTFMTRLVMQVAPIADIYIIRVAENTTDLENHEQRLANAIMHAGLSSEWGVDIISMSFGIPHERRTECRAISDAIERVTKERNGSVLFFAAAGNSPIEKENFPASHKDVISIYATNSAGTFLESTPAQPKGGPELLGTYGTDIPPSITEEIRTAFPEADLSAGSSVATAIAVGVAAMTLSYSTALPALLDLEKLKPDFDKLLMKNGMEQMLYIMSIAKATNCYFINPIGYWGEKGGNGRDKMIFYDICAAIGKIKD